MTNDAYSNMAFDLPPSYAEAVTGVSVSSIQGMNQVVMDKQWNNMESSTSSLDQENQQLMQELEDKNWNWLSWLNTGVIIFIIIIVVLVFILVSYFT